MCSSLGTLSYSGNLVSLKAATLILKQACSLQTRAVSHSGCLVFATSWKIRMFHTPIVKSFLVLWLLMGYLPVALSWPNGFVMTEIYPTFSKGLPIWDGLQQRIIGKPHYGSICCPSCGQKASSISYLPLPLMAQSSQMVKDKRRKWLNASWVYCFGWLWLCDGYSLSLHGF